MIESAIETIYPVGYVAPKPIQQQIVDAAQERLDDFARTRDYEGILSACSYAASAVPTFQVEGQYCAAVRDATWAKLSEMLAEVLSGTRPIPSSFADLVDDLPPLEWPPTAAVEV